MNTSANHSVLKQYLSQTGSFIWEILKVVIISLLIIIPVRYFLIQPFYVKGASMEPNFYDFEYLIIDELSYRFGEPERFDVVVLRDPSDTSQFFIKRVVGLPGEEVLVRDGTIRINGVDLDETSFLPDDVYTDGFEDETVTVGENEYYVVGDNRPASYDSRRFGPVEDEKIIGRVWIRAWPFNRWTYFE